VKQIEEKNKLLVIKKKKNKKKKKKKKIILKYIDVLNIKLLKKCKSFIILNDKKEVLKYKS